MVVWITIKSMLKYLLIALLTKRAKIKLLMVFGDWIVDNIEGTLDDKAWAVVRTGLEKQLKS